MDRIERCLDNLQLKKYPAQVKNIESSNFFFYFLNCIKRTFPAVVVFSLGVSPFHSTGLTTAMTTRMVSEVLGHRSKEDIGRCQGLYNSEFRLPLERRQI